MNNKNRVNGFKVVSTGSLTASLVHPREVWRSALNLCAAAVVFVHNHPSGDPTPSPQDIEVTNKLMEVGEMLDIPLVDHVIIGEHRCLSLRERGVIK